MATTRISQLQRHREQRLAHSWLSCANARKPLQARRKLGEAFEEHTAGIKYGEVAGSLERLEDRILRSGRAVSRRHIRSEFYRAAQFAKCCEHDPKLQALLEDTGLSWRMVTELLSLLCNRRDATGPARTAITQQLKRVLKRCINGGISPTEAVRQLKQWRQENPEVFQDRLREAAVAQAWRDIRRSLGEAEDTCKVIKTQTPGGSGGLTRGLSKAIRGARKELESASRQNKRRSGKV